MAVGRAVAAPEVAEFFGLERDLPLGVQLEDAAAGLLADEGPPQLVGRQVQRQVRAERRPLPVRPLPPRGHALLLRAGGLRRVERELLAARRPQQPRAAPADGPVVVGQQVAERLERIRLPAPEQRRRRRQADARLGVLQQPDDLRRRPAGRPAPRPGVGAAGHPGQRPRDRRREAGRGEPAASRNFSRSPARPSPPARWKRPRSAARPSGPGPAPAGRASAPPPAAARPSSGRPLARGGPGWPGPAQDVCRPAPGLRGRRRRPRPPLGPPAAPAGRSAPPWPPRGRRNHRRRAGGSGPRPACGSRRSASPTGGTPRSRPRRA